MREEDSPVARGEKARGALSLFLLLAVLFFGGMFSGMGVAAYFAPGSALAQFAGFFMLPLSLGLSMTLWYKVAAAIIIARLGKAGWRAYRNRTDFRQTAKAELEAMERVPPATWMFLPIPPMVCLGAGVVIGMSPAATSFFSVVAVCTLMGLAYGVLLYRLAQTGHLPMPEEV